MTKTTTIIETKVTDFLRGKLQREYTYTHVKTINENVKKRSCNQNLRLQPDTIVERNKIIAKVSGMIKAQEISEIIGQSLKVRKN